MSTEPWPGCLLCEGSVVVSLETGWVGWVTSVFGEFRWVSFPLLSTGEWITEDNLRLAVRRKGRWT